MATQNINKKKDLLLLYSQPCLPCIVLSYKKIDSMLSENTVVDRERFEAALGYLEGEDINIELSRTQKTFIDLVKYSTVDKRMVLRESNKEFLVAVTSESEELVSVLYPHSSNAGKMYAIAVAFAVVAVSQPDTNCAIMLTKYMAPEFIKEVSDVLDLFRESREFGWSMQAQDLRKFVRIKTDKHNTTKSIRACTKDTQRGMPGHCFVLELCLQ